MAYRLLEHIDLNYPTEKENKIFIIELKKLAEAHGVRVEFKGKVLTERTL